MTNLSGANVSGLLDESRASLLRTVLSCAFQTPIRMLEIGVWRAQGSTQIWFENLLPGSELILLDSWSPYASADDLNHDVHKSNWDYAKMDLEVESAYQEAQKNIRDYEAKDNNSKVVTIRGRTESVAPLIKDNTFDLIFIDGDHKYDSVKKDLVEAKRILNQSFGIICGDDLEKKPDKIDLDVCRQYKNRDYLDLIGGFHPGVALAISEEFAAVNMIDGFWWVVCHDHKFTTDIITENQVARAIKN